MGWHVSGKVQELLCLQIWAGRTGLVKPETKGGTDRNISKPGQPVTAATVSMCALGNVLACMWLYTHVCTSLCS